MYPGSVCSLCSLFLPSRIMHTNALEYAAISRRKNSISFWTRDVAASYHHHPYDRLSVPTPLIAKPRLPVHSHSENSCYAYWSNRFWRAARMAVSWPWFDHSVWTFIRAFTVHFVYCISISTTVKYNIVSRSLYYTGQSMMRLASVTQLNKDSECDGAFLSNSGR